MKIPEHKSYEEKQETKPDDEHFGPEELGEGTLLSLITLVIIVLALLGTCLHVW